jgi:hypothetical protein
VGCDARQDGLEHCLRQQATAQPTCAIRNAKHSYSLILSVFTWLVSFSMGLIGGVRCVHYQEDVAALVEEAVGACSAEYQRGPKVEVLDGILKVVAELRWSAALLGRTSSAPMAMLRVCIGLVQQGRLPSTAFAAEDVSCRIALRILRASGAWQGG